MRIPDTIWAVVVVAIFACETRLAADGCFMTVEVKELHGAAPRVQSPKQEAILATDGQRVQVVLRTHFQKGPRELAWVVPVPGTPTGIRTCDDSLFVKLDELTAPRFYQMTFRSSGLHLGCAANGHLAAESASISAVRVEARGKAGIYDYTVLSAKDPRELENWLHRNQYAVPKGASKVFAKYTSEGWHWLALKVRAEASKEEVIAPQPILYSYEGKLTFPLVISTLSAAEETEVVLYLVGGSSFDTAGCPSADLNGNSSRRTDRTGREHGLRLPSVSLDPGSPSGTTYEKSVRDLSAKHGGRLFVRELCERWQLFGREGMGRRFDGVLDGAMVDSLGSTQSVTRFRGFIRKGNMDADVQFEAGEVEHQIQNRFYVQARASSSHSGLALLCLCPLGVLCAFSRIPNRWGRNAPGVLLAMLCLATLFS